MKINVCDPCRLKDGTLVETTRYVKVKNRPDLRMDVCDKHNAEWKAKHRGIEKYVKWFFAIRGQNMTPTQVSAYLKTRGYNL